MSVTVRLDTNSLKDLFADVNRDLEAAVRPAAQAAAQILVDEVKRNVGKIGKVTGNLSSSIYQVYSKSSSGKGRAVYHVSWNAAKAPHGHLLEFGHMQRYRTIVNEKTGRWVTLKKYPLATPRQVGARPFVRPAQAKFAQAIEAARAELLQRIDGGAP